MKVSFRRFAAILAAGAFVFGEGTQAVEVTHQVTVSGRWFDGGGHPYGMPDSPTIVGWITVDSPNRGLAALLDFSLTTGSKTWTEEDFVGPTADLRYDADGNLTFFSLSRFSDGAGWMEIYSNNTMQVVDGNGAFNGCNGCVQIGPRVSPPVPEPSAAFLLGAGLAALGLGAAWAARRPLRPVGGAAGLRVHSRLTLAALSRLPPPL